MLCTAALIAGWISVANAGAVRRTERETEHLGPPRLAVIALAQQRISVYGAKGRIMQAPVSTGATGHETPAGIYSILDKEEEHHSNLYDDASMPFMQRLTWTGIAMHAGHLPGYPASHGCTRLPYGFAQQLYQVTKPGMRVVIVREDIAPVETEQPEMFNRGSPPASQVSKVEIDMSGLPDEAKIQARLQAIKDAKLAEAEAAKKRALQARSVAAKRAAEAASASRLVEAAQAALARMEAALKANEGLQPALGRTSKGETAGAIEVKVEAARLRLDALSAQAQAKMNAAAQAEEEAAAASAASSEAAEAAEIARENTWPISIFISRKTQRIYIRRGREPVYEGPVTIRDPDKPLGTFVFTAVDYSRTPGRLRWNVVSLYKHATAIEPYSGRRPASKQHRSAEPADAAGARDALQRLVIPEEAVDHISGLLPGSSLIVSDEGLSNETGKDTDFIVFMSGEPQGGATSRIALASQPAGRSQWQRRRELTRRASPFFFSPGGRAAGAAWRSRGFSPFFFSPFGY